MMPRGPVGTDRPRQAHMCIFYFIFIDCFMGQMLIGLLISGWSTRVSEGLVMCGSSHSGWM